ncbi:hypothetical protein EV127DRAFT_421826 [Xylaria flabelliformis]|nr:hypothetical protein EV127DRAFT_421826 [Xylaria flabelliformis]
MPAIMDDPSAPTIHRVSGASPYPDPNKPALPTDIRPRQVTLRDRQTIATVVPFVSREQVPPSLLRYLSDQFAKEIEGGDTYPMIDPMPFEKFSAYWLQNFAGIMLLGQINSPDEVVEDKDWSQECLGSFYIKPNYPGRSSHVCNAGFLVTDASRNRGVGRLMGETYLDWAPKLGYTYSVFNLVYETNVASCRIWDALGFKRIGRVKGCGNLKSYPDRLVDAIIYGRDLGTDAGDGGDPLLVSEERFDKIKFYLKYGRYPNGSDRAEKSRLRSAATHYKLLDNDVLMLKGKEVISDPVRQMAVARRFHVEGGHAGINKTTSVIAEKYHWSRIKETVSDVIRTCDQCKDAGKSPSVQAQNQNQTSNQNQSISQSQDFGSVSRQFHDVNETHNISDNAADLMAPQPPSIHESRGVEADSRILDLHHTIDEAASHHGLASHLTNSNPYAHPSDISSLLNPAFETPSGTGLHVSSPHLMLHGGPHHASAAATLASLHDTEMYHPIDPQIISQPIHNHPHHHHHTEGFHSFHARIPVSLHHHSHPDHQHAASPHMSHSSILAHDLEYSPHVSHGTLPSHALHGMSGHDPSHEHDDTDSFQALLNDPDTDTTLTAGSHNHHHHTSHHHHHGIVHRDHHTPDHDHDHDHEDAVDRDMAMLIEHHDDSPSPSPDPCISSPSSLRCEMDIDDDLGLGVLHRKRSREDDDRGRGGKDVSGSGTCRTSGGPDDGDVDTAFDGTAGTKRSDIYDVVFHPPG